MEAGTAFRRLLKKSKQLLNLPLDKGNDFDRYSKEKD